MLRAGLRAEEKILQGGGAQPGHVAQGGVGKDQVGSDRVFDETADGAAKSVVFGGRVDFF